jgi:hypothetical protein
MCRLRAGILQGRPVAVIDSVKCGLPWDFAVEGALDAAEDVPVLVVEEVVGIESWHLREPVGLAEHGAKNRLLGAVG